MAYFGGAALGRLTRLFLVFAGNKGLGIRNALLFLCLFLRLFGLFGAFGLFLRLNLCFRLFGLLLRGLFRLFLDRLFFCLGLFLSLGFFLLLRLGLLFLRLLFLGLRFLFGFGLLFGLFRLFLAHSRRLKLL